MRTYLSYLCGYSTMVEEKIRYTHTNPPTHTPWSHTHNSFCLAFNSCQKYYLKKSILHFLSETMHFIVQISFII